MKLYPVPLELREANDAIAKWHRHHKPTNWHRFSVGCVDEEGVLHGVAVIHKPVARLAGHPRDILEVSRVATDGTPNACSILYGASAKVAKALGYLKIQTYTLPSESGSSLRAAGWVCEGKAGGGQWRHTDGKPRRTDQPVEKKLRWSVTFNATPRPVIFPTENNFSDELNTEELFLL